MKEEIVEAPHLDYDETVGISRVSYDTFKAPDKWMVNQFRFTFEYEAHTGVDIDALVEVFRKTVTSRVPVKVVDREV